MIYTREQTLLAAGHPSPTGICCTSNSFRLTHTAASVFWPIVLIRSMIGYWHQHVVCPSVHLTVTLCIMAPRVGVRTKSCTSVFLAGMFLFVPSNTVAVACVVLWRRPPGRPRQILLHQIGDGSVVSICQQWDLAFPAIWDYGPQPPKRSDEFHRRTSQGSCSPLPRLGQSHYFSGKS